MVRGAYGLCVTQAGQHRQGVGQGYRDSQAHARQPIAGRASQGGSEGQKALRYNITLGTARCVMSFDNLMRAPKKISPCV